MPTSLDDYIKYLGAGTRTLSREELEAVARETGIGSRGPLDVLIRSVERHGKLRTKIGLIVRGMRASGMEKEELWHQWGRLLMRVYAQNIAWGTDLDVDLGQHNRELLNEISKGYIEAGALARHALEELGLPAALAGDAIESASALAYTRWLPTMHGLVRFVCKEDAEGFSAAIAAALAQPAAEEQYDSAEKHDAGSRRDGLESRTAESIQPYLDLLVKIALQAANMLPKSTPPEVSLAWDKDAVEKGIVLDDVVTNFTMQSPEGLTPVEQAALVAYAMHESRAPAAEKLELLTEALYLYSRIDSIAGGFRQRSAVLRFFRNDVPRLIHDAGYLPLGEGLRQITGEELAAKEAEFLFDRITDSMPHAIAEFYSESGAAEYVLVNDENASKAIAGMAYNALPRLIEGRGYRQLAKVAEEALPEKLRGKRRQEAYKALMENADVLSHAKGLDTMEGRILYVAPEMREAAARITTEKASWHALSPRQKRRLEREEALRKALEHPVFSYVQDLDSALRGMHDGSMRSNQGALRSANQIERQLRYLEGGTRALVVAELKRMTGEYKSIGKRREFSTSWRRLKELRDEYRGGVMYRALSILRLR